MGYHDELEAARQRELQQPLERHWPVALGHNEPPHGEYVCQKVAGELRVYADARGIDDPDNDCPMLSICWDYLICAKLLSDEAIAALNDGELLGFSIQPHSGHAPLMQIARDTHDDEIRHLRIVQGDKWVWLAAIHEDACRDYLTHLVADPFDESFGELLFCQMDAYSPIHPKHAARRACYALAKASPAVKAMMVDLYKESHAPMGS